MLTPRLPTPLLLNPPQNIPIHPIRRTLKQVRKPTERNPNHIQRNHTIQKPLPFCGLLEAEQHARDADFHEADAPGPDGGRDDAEFGAVFDGGDGAEGGPAGGEDVGFGGDHDAVHGAEDEL